ncbi:hypothetical protein KZY93_004246 [Vibrio vulnificus]|nr:hypothetical protein [Vibrio vulnificus]
MDFIIVYERLNREYQNAVLLKVELEKRGYKCLISQYYEADNYLKSIFKKEHIILVPNMYIGRNIYRTVSRFGKPKCIVNLQYEQVLSEKWEKLGHHNPKGAATLCQHVCWGENTRVRLVNAGVPSDNAHTLGAIQLDLLRNEFRDNKNSLRKSLSRRYNIDIGQKTSLFLSSFTYADISPSRLQMNEKAAGVKLDSFVDIHTKSRNKILKWLELFLIDNKETTLIYRPHPDELNLSPVVELESRYSNFVICAEGAAKEWIEVSDFVMTWYSTTVVETHLLNIPYVILRPVDLPDDFDSVLLKKGDFVENYDELAALTARAFNGLNVKALRDDDIYDYYNVCEEKPSYIRYADFLIDIKESKCSFDFNYKFSKMCVARANTFMVFVIFYIYKTLRKIGKLRIFEGRFGWLDSWMKELDAQIKYGDYEEKVTNYVKEKFNVI